MTERGTQYLPSAYLGSGWFGEIRYYVHNNRLYLQGVLVPDGTVGTTLLNLPIGLRPPTDQSLTISVMGTSSEIQESIPFAVPLVEDPATPGIGISGANILPRTLGVTMGADGILALASLPPYINTVPDPTVYFNNGGAIWSAPFKYYLYMGSLSWELAAPGVDSPVWESVSPYLGSNWENIDGEIAVDKAAVLLRGHVRAIKNGGSDMMYHYFGPEPGIEQPLFARLPTGANDWIDADTYTIAQGPHFPVPLHVVNGLVYALDDTRYVGRTGSGGNDHSPGYMKLPMDEGESPPMGDVGSEWWPIVNDNPFQGGHWDSGDARPTVAGVSSHTGPLDSFTQFGFFVPAPGGNRAQGVPVTNYSDSGTFETGDLSVTGFVHEYLDVFHPAPDWVALTILCWNTTTSDSGGVSMTLTPSAPCELLYGFDGVTPVPFTAAGPGVFFGGYVGQPDGHVDYDYDQYNPFLNMIWRPEDVPDEWTLEATFVGVSGVFGPGESLNMNIQAIPLWNAPRNCILAGDILTLDGASWQAPFQAGNWVHILD